MADGITPYDDIINTKDVERRLQKLQDEFDSLQEAWAEAEARNDKWAMLNAKQESDWWREEYRSELEFLLEIRAKLGDSPGYASGIVLVAEDYMADHARDVAEEMAAKLGVDLDDWPFSHIDWESAADDLAEKYVRHQFGDEFFFECR